MGLDNLLATLERRTTETYDTPCNRGEVSPKPAPLRACTLDTPDTRQNGNAGNDTRKVGADDERREKVLALLAADSKLKRAVHADTDSDPDSVILTVAIRHVATCEMLVPKANFDPWQLLALVDKVEADYVH